MLKKLLAWYKKHGRHDLPWRKTRDPYKVLVSELMLQQTQVSRVIPKYKAFVKRWPTVHALAAAERRDVLQMWQGLGYNSRAVRLHVLAKLVVAEYDGKLPTRRAELLKLPGIGPYTAGAVMIFAHEKQSESLDVNVIRVIKRTSWTKRAKPSEKAVAKKALEILEKRPHDVQSALMDLGSTYCTATPSCSLCPLKTSCKSQGVRPDETKKKQPAFKGSNRWWRGQILKHVLAGNCPSDRISELIKENPSVSDREMCDRAIRDMVSEGLIVERRGRLTL